MNIRTVRDNLKNTISGKEKLLESWKSRTSAEWEQAGVSYEAMRRMVEINIDELKRILQDVEACCEQATYDSWKENPDRMGGQFTQDELNREWN